MKWQRSTEQFYPKAGIENLPSDAQQSGESVQFVGLYSSDQSRSKPTDKSQAGQIVVEYVLMLLVAIAIAVLLINFIVSRQEGNEGFLIKAWGGIIQTISDDKTDEAVPESTPTP